MTVKIKYKIPKFKTIQNVIAVFYDKGKLLLKGVSQHHSIPIDKIDSFSMYDYD